MKLNNYSSQSKASQRLLDLPIFTQSPTSAPTPRPSISIPTAMPSEQIPSNATVSLFKEGNEENPITPECEQLFSEIFQGRQKGWNDDVASSDVLLYKPEDNEDGTNDGTNDVSNLGGWPRTVSKQMMCETFLVLIVLSESKTVVAGRLRLAGLIRHFEHLVDSWFSASAFERYLSNSINTYSISTLSNASDDAVFSINQNINVMNPCFLGGKTSTINAPIDRVPASTLIKKTHYGLVATAWGPIAATPNLMHDTIRQMNRASHIMRMQCSVRNGEFAGYFIGSFFGALMLVYLIRRVMACARNQQKAQKNMLQENLNPISVMDDAQKDNTAPATISVGQKTKNDMESGNPFWINDDLEIN